MITIPPVFSDNMVLQQGVPVPVWGMAKAKAEVTVRFGEASVTAKADASGAWEAKLPAMEASATPRVLTVETGSGAGAEKLSFSNVLVGEVWLASGQSNMEWSVANSNNAPVEIAAAQFPQIRLFTVPRHSAETLQPTFDATQWKICTPENVGTFSAVAYFFGRELHAKLGVPIGLISSSVGGTTAESWVSREGLLATPETKGIIDELEENRPLWEEQREAWEEEMELLNERVADAANIGFARGWASPLRPRGDWRTMELPGAWQTRGHNYSGVFWFRKEVTLPPEWAGKELELGIGATDKSDTTYFNGYKVGGITMKQRDDAWAVQRVYKVPGKQAKAGKNVVAVRVHSDRYMGGMTGPAEALYLRCPELAGSERISLVGVWDYAIEVNYGPVEPPAEPLAPGNWHFPTGLFNGMIAPLIPYALRGFIWYQGEANVGRAAQYKALFPALIRDWRRHWGALLGSEDLAFYFVQLANHLPAKPEPAESPWAELREAQLLTLTVPHTGMAVAIDIGEADDIHPRNKQDVGLRLAASALRQTYDKADVAPGGPILKTCVFKNGAVKIGFYNDGTDNAASGCGLVCKGEKLQGFALAGEDGKFAWADAKIEADRVVVSSPNVPYPKSVRYAWADNPACNLYNSAGLPASPFRAEDDGANEEEDAAEAVQIKAEAMEAATTDAAPLPTPQADPASPSTPKADAEPVPEVAPVAEAAAPALPALPKPPVLSVPVAPLSVPEPSPTPAPPSAPEADAEPVPAVASVAETATPAPPVTEIPTGENTAEAKDDIAAVDKNQISNSQPTGKKVRYSKNKKRRR